MKRMVFYSIQSPIGAMNGDVWITPRSKLFEAFIRNNGEWISLFDCDCSQFFGNFERKEIQEIKKLGGPGIEK